LGAKTVGIQGNAEKIFDLSLILGPLSIWSVFLAKKIVLVSLQWIFFLTLILDCQNLDNHEWVILKIHHITFIIHHYLSMTNQGFLSYIRELISKGDLRTALTQLRLLLRNSPNLDDALLQSARFNDLLTSIKLGTIGNDEATVTKTRIIKGILDMLRDIEEREKQPDIHAEIEKALRFTEELSEYNRIKEKIQANRGADTSELLKDKTSNDLDEKTVSRLFQNERALIALTEGGLTADDSIQKWPYL
jgi:hypothetical protein